MSTRAVECKNYSRGLVYWEQYIRERTGGPSNPEALEDQSEKENMYERLQYIYAQIEETDGIEGVSTYLQGFGVDQQIIEHRKAGRWTAVQGGYEMLLGEDHKDTNLQFEVLLNLKESKQYGT